MENQGAARVPAEDLERQIEQVKARLKKLQRVDRELRQKHENKRKLLASLRRAGEKYRVTEVELEKQQESYQAGIDSYVEQKKSLAEQWHQLNVENLSDTKQECESVTEAVTESIEEGEVFCVDAVGGIIEGTLGDVQEFFQITDDLESKEEKVFEIEGAIEEAELEQKALAELTSGLEHMVLAPFEVQVADEPSEV